MLSGAGQSYAVFVGFGGYLVVVPLVLVAMVISTSSRAVLYRRAAVSSLSLGISAPSLSVYCLGAVFLGADHQSFLLISLLSILLVAWWVFQWWSVGTKGLRSTKTIFVSVLALVALASLVLF